MRREWGFRRAALLLATLSLSLGVVAGCSSESEGASSASSSNAALQGAYQGSESSTYAWAGFGGDRYALWKKGAACNDDYASAPADCLESGSFSFDEGARTVTFVDDATGEPATFPATFGFQGSGALAESGSLTTKNLGGGDGLVDRNQETANPSGDELVVADLAIVKKGLHVVFVACALLTGNPTRMPTVTPPPPPITRTISGGNKECKG